MTTTLDDLDGDELFCLLYLALPKLARVAKAREGIIPADGTSARLAQKGLCIQIAVDPKTYKPDPGNFLATDQQGGMAVVELTAIGRQLLFENGAMPKPKIG